MTPTPISVAMMSFFWCIGYAYGKRRKGWSLMWWGLGGIVAGHIIGILINHHVS